MPLKCYAILFMILNLSMFCAHRYLDYGEEMWKKEAAKCLSGLET